MRHDEATALKLGEEFLSQYVAGLQLSMFVVKNKRIKHNFYDR